MRSLGEYNRIVFNVSLLISIIFFIFTIYLGYMYINNPSNILEEARQNAIDQAEDAAEVINSNLTMSMIIAQRIANDLNSGILKDAQLVQRMKDTLNESMKKYPFINGISVAYKPYSYQPDRRLYAPYYLMENGMLHLIQIEDVQDYTRPDLEGGTGPRTEWYHKPMEEGPCWFEPFFGTYTLITDYEVPFYRPNDSEEGPTGTVGVDYSLDGIRSIVGSLDLGETGYGFVVTERGTIVSHPIREYLGKNITNLKTVDKNLQLIYSNISHGVQNQKIIYNNHTGQILWVFYEKIPSTNWTMCTVFVEDEVLFMISEKQRKLEVQIGLSVIVFLFALSIILFGAYKGSSRSIWAAAISFSILCIAGTVLMWYLALNIPSSETCQDVAILDNVGSQAYLSKQIHEVDHKKPMQIPTGLFIQSLEFESANDIIVTGYIWQNYSENTTIGASSPCVVFPELVECKEIKESYRSGNMVGWRFGAIVRQQFDYSKYPFDREDVWIRLWPCDFRKNIVLIPDLDSYAVIQPEFRPGLDDSIVTEGWNIQNSFFSYRSKSYNSDFGIESRKYDSFPELYFNIGMKRNFVGIFMSEIIPIAVTSLLLFAVLMISTKREDEIDLYGFSASAVLAYCAALFFVLTVAHFSIRQRIPADGIIYLEYFYFVLYFAILAVSVNSILFASRKGHNLILYKNNLFIKLLYWPIISCSILGFTLMNFY